jgi:hypothetical protein
VEGSHHKDIQTKNKILGQKINFISSQKKELCLYIFLGEALNQGEPGILS